MAQHQSMIGHGHGVPLSRQAQLTHISRGSTVLPRCSDAQLKCLACRSPLCGLKHALGTVVGDIYVRYSTGTGEVNVRRKKICTNSLWPRMCRTLWDCAMLAVLEFKKALSATHPLIRRNFCIDVYKNAGRTTLAISLSNRIKLFKELGPLLPPIPA